MHVSDIVEPLLAAIEITKCFIGDKQRRPAMLKCNDDIHLGLSASCKLSNACRTFLPSSGLELWTLAMFRPSSTIAIQHLSAIASPLPLPKQSSWPELFPRATSPPFLSLKFASLYTPRPFKVGFTTIRKCIVRKTFLQTQYKESHIKVALY